MKTKIPTLHARTMFREKGQERGAVLVFALLTILVLSMVAANVLSTVNTKYNSLYQAASWQEALPAAEAGIDLAIAELREALPLTGVALQPPVRSANDPLIVTLTHGGEGNVETRARVSWDVAFAIPGTDLNYYRIRSEGIAGVAGPQRAAGDSRDHVLRRLSLVTDRRTGEALDRGAQDLEDRPKATRAIEVVMRPTSGFQNAITAASDILLNNHNIFVASFTSDTADPDFSSSNYASLLGSTHEERLQHHMQANVATNGQILDAGQSSIYGDGMTNEGEVRRGENIYGEVRNDFYMDLPEIEAPNWTVVEASPTEVTSSGTTLVGGTSLNPTRYKLDRIQLSGNNQMHIANPPGQLESHVEIWVTGDISLTGRGGITMDPGVNATVYFEGDANLSGNGFINPAPNRARNLQLYGIAPPEGATRNVTIAGNGTFVGALYAPGHYLSMRGGGNSDSVVGSFVAKEVFMNGTTSVMYDRSLANDGIITDYLVSSWFEDYRN